MKKSIALSLLAISFLIILSSTGRGFSKTHTWTGDGVKGFVPNNGNLPPILREFDHIGNFNFRVEIESLFGNPSHVWTILRELRILN